MHRSKKLAMIVSLTLPHFVMASTVTQFTSSMTGSLAAAQSSDCAAIVSSCPFAQTACVSYWCSYSCNDQSSCCQQTNSQACLVSANLQDPCFNIENSIILCTATVAADCLCYDDARNYAPSSFDNMAQSCSQLAVTASPSLLSLLTGSEGSLGYCTNFAGPKNSSVITTSPSTMTGNSHPSPTPTQTGGKNSVSPSSNVSQAADKATVADQFVGIRNSQIGGDPFGQGASQMLAPNLGYGDGFWARLNLPSW